MKLEIEGSLVEILMVLKAIASKGFKYDKLKNRMEIIPDSEIKTPEQALNRATKIMSQIANSEDLTPKSVEKSQKTQIKPEKHMSKHDEIMQRNKELKHLWKSDMPTSEIAKKFGTDKHILSVIAANLKLGRRKVAPERTKKEIKKVEHLPPMKHKTPAISQEDREFIEEMAIK